MLWWWLAAWGAEPEPIATVIYYNARMALAEGQPLEAAKLWLLRNAVADKTGQISPHDADFGSVTWAALGDLGICQDGQPLDEDAAGLWPLALHNWVVRNMGHKAKKQKPRPWDAFQVGRQMRLVSIRDVLGSGELGEVSLFRGHCLRQRRALLDAGESLTASLADRQVVARLLLSLLQRAEFTLDPENVRGRAVIDARRFDLYLQLTALSAREARSKQREAAREGRALGLSRDSVSAMAEEAPDYTFGPESEPARILRDCVGWPVSDWMALSAERRRFLFLHANAYGGDRATLDEVSLGILDALIADGEGAEAEAWIGIWSRDGASPEEAIWGGERGEHLLALDPAHGFGERGVVALHRGVQQLEEGDLPGALRSVAYALQHATESRAAEQLQPLCRRWLSYIAGQFAVTDELLATLKELVPPRDFSSIVEDLAWGAAFRADRDSFDRGVEAQVGQGAGLRRLDRLEPLAAGDVGRFATLIRKGLAEAPSETLRFLDQLLARLELEDADVRSAQVGTLVQVRKLLQPLSSDESGRTSRTATALLERSQALLEGLGGWGGDTAEDRARALGPKSEVFVGSVRLAPNDALPWPFTPEDVPAPSVFVPIGLIPVEWKDAAGGTVFGWRLGG